MDLEIVLKTVLMYVTLVGFFSALYFFLLTVTKQKWNTVGLVCLLIPIVITCLIHELEVNDPGLGNVIELFYLVAASLIFTVLNVGILKLKNSNTLNIVISGILTVSFIVLRLNSKSIHDFPNAPTEEIPLQKN